MADPAKPAVNPIASEQGEGEALSVLRRPGYCQSQQ